MIKDLAVRRKVRSKEQDEPNKEEVRKDELNKFNPILPAYRKKPDEKVLVLCETLNQAAPDSAVFLCLPMKNLPEAVENFIVHNVANKILEDPGNDTNEKKISSFLRSLPISDQGLKVIERKTKGQADNDFWINLRKGRLTASKDHDICTKMHSSIKCTGAIKPKTTPIVQKIMHLDNDISHMPAVKWGRDHESLGVKAFFIKEERNHDDLKVQKCGLFVDAKKPYIAASPDGLVTCKCHGLAVLEVKCPYSLHDMEISEISIQKCAFLKLDEKRTVALNRSHKCYTQLVSQIALTGANHCFFVVWTQKDLFVEKIKFILVTT